MKLSKMSRKFQEVIEKIGVSSPFPHKSLSNEEQEKCVQERDLLRRELVSTSKKLLDWRHLSYQSSLKIDKDKLSKHVLDVAVPWFNQFLWENQILLLFLDLSLCGVSLAFFIRNVPNFSTFTSCASLHALFGF